MNEPTAELGTVEAQTEEQRVVHTLGLLVSARDPLMTSFGTYLLASQRLEAWLAAGAPTDEESARAISGDIKTALSALTALGTAALGIAGVSARAVGIEPDKETAN
jgi:hypothetical protein